MTVWKAEITPKDITSNKTSLRNRDFSMANPVRNLEGGNSEDHYSLWKGVTSVNEWNG